MVFLHSTVFSVTSSLVRPVKMKNISATVLPQLQLSDQDSEALQELAAELETELLTQYESYALQRGRELDLRRWKHARSEDDVMAFRERKNILHLEHEAHAQAKRCQLSGRGSRATFPPQATLAIESLHPRILVAGLQVGSLDDIMYGLTYQDTASFQAFWDSQNNELNKSAVLAKVKGPSLEDPYRFLGVTWGLRTYPLPSALLHQRDWVMLGDIRMAKLSNGERIGISILHSIELRGVPELRDFGTVRATCSMLQLFRQHDRNRVEVFSLNLLDIKGHAMESINVFQSLNYIVPTTCYANAHGFNKKLRWLISKTQRTRQLVRGESCNVIEPQSSGDGDHCEQCSKSLKRIFSSSGTTCQLCHKRVCCKCSASHTLPPGLSGGKPKAVSIHLCIECMLQTRVMSALTVAREEIAVTSKARVPTKLKRLTPTDRGSIHVVYL